MPLLNRPSTFRGSGHQGVQQRPRTLDNSRIRGPHIYPLTLPETASQQCRQHLCGYLTPRIIFWTGLCTRNSSTPVAMVIIPIQVK